MRHVAQTRLLGTGHDQLHLGRTLRDGQCSCRSRRVQLSQSSFWIYSRLEQHDRDVSRHLRADTHLCRAGQCRCRRLSHRRQQHNVGSLCPSRPRLVYHGIGLFLHTHVHAAALDGPQYPTGRCLPRSRSDRHCRSCSNGGCIWLDDGGPSGDGRSQWEFVTARTGPSERLGGTSGYGYGTTGLGWPGQCHYSCLTSLSVAFAF